MFSEVYYLLRSKVDGQYLAAHQRGLETQSERPSPGYLILFSSDYDALSYLNTHGAEVADRFAVESLAGSQLKSLMERWSFEGIGLVKDPLVPEVEFLRRERNL